ncbi:hypothetical protein RJ640_023564 [Escallonia rubra]|uniref:DUF4283 domain-containing protein n=1 Tax=Escallonia rubra TaxID=112253 RepID=A0AA88UF23_9ASTE|nr:hypothetical protein RJ640_023564 [Escallonia rubra]
MEEPLALERSGHMVFVPPELSSANQLRWQHTLVGRFADDRVFTCSFVQAMVDQFWTLTSATEVEAVDDYFAFHFSADCDLDCIISHGPWNMNGALLVVAHWHQFSCIPRLDFSTAFPCLLSRARPVPILLRQASLHRLRPIHLSQKRRLSDMKGLSQPVLESEPIFGPRARALDLSLSGHFPDLDLRPTNATSGPLTPDFNSKGKASLSQACEDLGRDQPSMARPDFSYSSTGLVSSIESNLPWACPTAHDVEGTPPGLPHR